MLQREKSGEKTKKKQISVKIMQKQTNKQTNGEGTCFLNIKLNENKSQTNKTGKVIPIHACNGPSRIVLWENPRRKLWYFLGAANTIKLSQPFSISKPRI